MTYSLAIPKEIATHPELKLDYWFKREGNIWQLIPNAKNPTDVGVRLARPGEFDLTGEIKDARLVDAFRAAMKNKKEIKL